MNLGFLFKTKGRVRGVFFAADLRQASTSRTTATSKAWLKILTLPPPLSQGVWLLCNVFIDITLKLFGGHWESGYELHRLERSPDSSRLWNGICWMCVCVFVGLDGLLRDRLTAWTCHCICQTQWQLFCETALWLLLLARSCSHQSHSHDSWRWTGVLFVWFINLIIFMSHSWQWCWKW